MASAQQTISSLAPGYTAEYPRGVTKEAFYREEGAPGSDWSWGWGWLGALLLWFAVFTVLFWLIFYSLRPSFVMRPGTNEVDVGKVLLAAVIAAIILVVIIWIIKALVSGRRC